MGRSSLAITFAIYILFDFLSFVNRLSNSYFEYRIEAGTISAFISAITGTKKSRVAEPKYGIDMCVFYSYWTCGASRAFLTKG